MPVDRGAGFARGPVVARTAGSTAAPAPSACAKHTSWVPFGVPRELWIGLALSALLVGPAALSGNPVGSAGAEAPGHLWVQWWAATAWPAWPTGTDLVVGAARWPLIDPLPTWIAGGVSTLTTPVVAWNLLWMGWIVVASLGGAALARSVEGVPEVGAVGLAMSPIWLGSITSGLTEDGAVGLVALALAALWAGRPVRAGLLLGLTAWCGLYLAWLGAFAAIPVALLAARRDRSWRFLLGGGLAVALAVPAALPFRDRLTTGAHRSGTPRIEVEPRWRLNPVRRADLAAFVAPGHEPAGPGREHPTYIGWSTLALATVPSPIWPAVGLLALVAADEPVFVGGQPRLSTNPVARGFDHLPFADRFNHRGRVWILGQLGLVALAARGARRWGRWAPMAPLVIGAEVALLSPARVPAPSLPADSPAIYTALADLPAGPVAILGGAGPGLNPQRVLYDQRAHGRRLLVDPNHPGPPPTCHGCVVVALGDVAAGETARRGPATVTAADGAAWWVP